MTRRLVAIAALILLAATLGFDALSADTPTTPGKPTISSVTAGDRQLTVNWSAPTTPSGKPVIDYQVMYRAGSSGSWTTGAAYSISYDSGVLPEPIHNNAIVPEATWTHDRRPLNLGTIASDHASGVGAYVECTDGGRHKRPCVYRIKQDVSAVRIRVDGEAGVPGTVRGSYTTEPITDLSHNGTEFDRVVVATADTAFSLSGITPPLSADSHFWIDGWDPTQPRHTPDPPFRPISISKRRLQIDIATLSTATSTTISGLVNQQSYQVRVRARNSDGWGAWSDASSSTPQGTPDAPTGLTLESGLSRFIARWTAPTNNGGSAISDYDIEYSSDSGTTWTEWNASNTSTSLTATITGLTNGTEYQVRVRAANSAGDGLWTEPVTDQTGKPSPPTFTISPVQRPLSLGKSDKGGLLSIGLSAADNGSDITDYDLRYREAGTTTWYTHRDRSHDSGKLTTSEASGAADPIDFGSFAASSIGVNVTHESIGTNAGLYKFSKAVDQLWIRASGTITGGGTVVARWHTSKPTAANLATAGTQIFSAATDSDNEFWQDGWIAVPANAYVWLHTSDTETLTERRLLLDFTDNSASMALPDSLSSARQTESDPSSQEEDDPIDFGTFGTLGSVTVTRESVGTGANAKAGVYKFSGAVDGLWIRFSGKAQAGTGVRARRHSAPPTDLDSDGTQIAFRINQKGEPVYTVIADSTTGWFRGEGGGFNLPANGYIWLQTEGLRTVSEHRLRLDATGNPMVLSGLWNGRTYELQARARNARGWGAWSEASATTGVPTRPDMNAPTAGHQALGVSWDQPWSDNGTAVTDYDVRYRTGSSGEWTSWAHNGTTRSTTISGLTNSTEYEIQIRAINARGAGFWSDSVKGTPAAQIPDAPAAPTLTSSGTTMTVSWTAPSANGAAISDYDIEYSSDSGTTWLPHLDSTFTYSLSGSFTTDKFTPLDFGNLPPSGSLTITLTRESVGSPAKWGVYKLSEKIGALKISASGVSTQGGFVIGRHADTKPTAATLTSHGQSLFDVAVDSNNQGAFSGSGTISEPAANSYFWVTGKTHPSNVPTTSRAIQLDWSSISTATSDTISSLTAATTYQVRVRARNSVGSGDWSTAATHTIGRPSAPAAPTLTTGNAQLTAEWTAASGNGSTITDYDVQYCSSNCASDSSWTSIADTTPSTALKTTITGLNNGTTYQVRVSAQNSAGNGPWSAAASIKVGLPGVPSPVTVVPGDGTLTVSWPAVSSNGSKLTDYDVRHCTTHCDQEGSWTEHSEFKNSLFTSATLRDLTNGTEYQIQVRADNQHGSGLWSATVKKKPGTPAAPSAPTLTAADHKIVVEWSAPANNGGTITDYDVQYKTSSASDWTEWQASETSTDTMAVIIGLTPTTTYQVQVRATNANGDSDWSASSTLTLPVSPVPNQSYPACDPANVTQLWVDDGCYLKSGVNGIKQFDAATILGSGDDYVRLFEYEDINVVDLTAYNPNGGLAVVQTTLAGVVQDTFLIDVIQFGIRSYSLSGELKAHQFLDLTVRLHSPDHGSPDKYMKNGVDYARSWVEVNLPSDLQGWDHKDQPTQDPIQVVDQHGDTATFRLFTKKAGTFSITITAYRPAPDAGCPTQGDLRCFVPPVDGLTKTYVVAEPASFSAFVAAPDPPTAPTGLTAVAGDQSVTLSWDDPQNTSISGYEYQMRWSGVAWQDWVAVPNSDSATTSHTVSGLTNGTEYRFHLRALNSGGSGAVAPNAHPWYVAATPEEPPDPPGAVASVNVSRADGTITASWDAPDRATSYHITYTNNGGQSWSLAAYEHTETSITISAANSDTYIVAVRARNSGGASGWRNSAPAGPFVPPATQPPAAVASISVTRADGTITASWDAPDGATSYHVTYTNDGGQSWSLAAYEHTETSITINAANSDTYIVGVRAKNSVGGSNWVNSPASGPYTPTPTNPPSAVPSVSVSRADGTITASWDAPDGATSYHITYSSNGGQSWSLAAFDHSSTSITINVTNSDTYIVGVRAKNSAGGSGWRNSPASGPFTP